MPYRTHFFATFLLVLAGFVAAAPGLAEEEASEPHPHGVPQISVLSQNEDDTRVRVRITRQFDDRTAPRDAWEELRVQALSEAIREVNGEHIMATLTDVAEESGMHSDYFVQMVSRSMVQGQIRRAGIRSRTAEYEGGSVFAYGLAMDVEVPRVRLDPTDLLSVRARLNRNDFLEGDEAVIQIRANRDAYVYLLNATMEGRIHSRYAFPNPQEPDNRVYAGAPFEIPSKKARARGRSFRVALRPGVERERYQLIALVTRRELPELLGTELGGVVTGEAEGGNTDVMRLIQALANYPLTDWTMSPLVYTVRQSTF